MSKAKGRWVGSGARVLWEPGSVSELIFPGCIQALGPETGTVKGWCSWSRHTDQGSWWDLGGIDFGVDERRDPHDIGPSQKCVAQRNSHVCAKLVLEPDSKLRQDRGVVRRVAAHVGWQGQQPSFVVDGHRYTVDLFGDGRVAPNGVP